jgi:hypothetical protein
MAQGLLLQHYRNSVAMKEPFHLSQQLTLRFGVCVNVLHLQTNNKYTVQYLTKSNTEFINEHNLDTISIYLKE